MSGFVFAVLCKKVFIFGGVGFAVCFEVLHICRTSNISYTYNLHDSDEISIGNV